MIEHRLPWRIDKFAVVAAVIVVAVGLFIHVLPWLGAGLGASDDGYNAGTWGLGARGGVEDPIGNRLGGIRPDGNKYAHHPPLMLWSLMTVAALDDHWPLGLRLVPLMASLASIVILAALLLDAGIGRFAAAAGVLLAGSSAMFLTFGAMVDTPVFSFPFALTAVWTAQRSWQGRPPPTPVVVVVGAFAALSGWQALLAAVVAAGVAALRPMRASRKAALALFAGAITGLAVDLAWVWWVMGSLTDLVDAGAFRGEVDASVRQWFTKQWMYAEDGFGLILVAIMCTGIIAILFATARHRTLASPASKPPEPDQPEATPPDGLPRQPPGADDGDRRSTDSAWATAQPLLAVVFTMVVGYLAIFRQGAFLHAYWNYFGVALVGVTAAALFDTADRMTRQFSAVGRTLVISLLAVLVVMVTALGFARRGVSDHIFRRGLDVVPLLEHLPTAHHPRDAVVATIGGVPDKPWLDWSTRGRHHVLDLADVKRLPTYKPVLVTLPYPVDESTWAGTTAKVNRVFVVIPAGELARLTEQ